MSEPFNCLAFWCLSRSCVDTHRQNGLDCIDMQMQHRVNKIEQGRWPRGLEVVVEGGQMRCRWTAQRTYGLVESYSRAPHLQFLKCKTDQQLASWVKAWGPIHLTAGQLSRDGGVVLSPISRYRSEEHTSELQSL